MGSCNSCNNCEQTPSNNELDKDKNSNQLVKIKQQMKDTSFKTKNDYEDYLVADEVALENSSQLPIFVKEKEIRENLVQERMNRFIKDIEEEVKYRIKQIQQEDQACYQVSLSKSVCHKTLKNQQQHSAEFNCTNFNHSISFENTQNLQTLRQIPSSTYLPKQYSQFAPRKDTETVTQNSQISQTINSIRLKTSKNQNKITSNLKEDLKSIYANCGSLNESQDNSASYSIKYSDCQSGKFSSCASKKQSARSILKSDQRLSNLQRNSSLKSTQTNQRQKKVSFSQDTYYYTSRTLKRNPTTLLHR
ncbi:unnamed protein product [Paramecium sonneborni]|uniref:Uncharacterized protein n=1 Tax=Paramecium sonneborni TaxID=65129 RepID=A0A8S1NXF0_9CILI|nr:unnamed protein product [Paramecium sonneborni]